MTPIASFALLLTLLCAGIAVVVSVRTQQIRKKLLAQEAVQKNRLYEISLFKEIQDKIGYELDREKIIDVITKTLGNMFISSICGSLYQTRTGLMFKVKIEDPVDQAFVNDTKRVMLESYAKLTTASLPLKISEEDVQGKIDPKKTKTLNSYFHVPLVVNNKPIGIITMALAKPLIFQEEQMTFVYNMVNQAINALSRLEEVLATEKEKLTSTIGSLADGIFMLDNNQQLFVINDAAKALLGIKTENPTVNELENAFPPTFLLTSKIHDAMTKKLGIQTQELILGEHTVQVFITPVMPISQLEHVNRHKNIPVVGVSVLLHDITLAKSITAMKEDFINMVVHDLRAPLTSIRGAAQLLSQEKTELNEDNQKLLAIIHTQSQQLLDQVTTLLDISHLQNGKITLKISDVNLNTMTAEQIQLFTPQALAKSITIIPHLDTTMPHIQADANLLAQVINNLLSNSIKFTSEQGKIGVTTRVENNAVIISISDTGRGIPKEKQAQLFSRFYRAGAGASTTGTGLGLYIVKNIVEAHKGTIKLDSEENKGTTITISLPLN